MRYLNNSFHKGSIRLAILYLAIIFAISLFFSATIYQLSIQELDRGLRGPRNGLERRLGPEYTQNIRNEILIERETVYQEAKERVFNRLVITNLIILFIGGFLSYYLALRTLKPIEEAHEAQSRFTADASHELRTPITAIVTENEVALSDPSLTLKEAKKQLSSNIEELHKLTQLSDSLMRLAGLENSSLHKEMIEGELIINKAIDRLKSSANAKNITIKTIIKNKVIINGDEQSLIELLTILLDNAIKYSPDKSIISIELQLFKGKVMIKVSDNGIGINASDVPHLFERFYRADSSRTKQSTSGYGLGLAIANNIVTKHSGSIKVKSTPNKGSTFTILLPN
jgi:signal transduction histidine kinase